MLGYIYSKITGKRSPRRGSQNEGDDLFFAGEDGHAERGDGHESHGRGDDIIGAGGGVLLIVGLGGVLGAVGDDDDGAAGGTAGNNIILHLGLDDFAQAVIHTVFHALGRVNGLGNGVIFGDGKGQVIIGEGFIVSSRIIIDEVASAIDGVAGNSS